MATSFPFESLVLLLGDKTVGKKALLRQYLEHTPPADQLTKLRSWQKIENIGGNLCSLRVSDCSYPSGFQYSAKIAQGSLVVFDLTNRDTFTNINAWLDGIAEHATAGFVKMLVGNKCDLTNQRQVCREEAEQLAASHGMKYFETTATDHESTSGPFQCVLGQLFEARAGMTGLHRAASAGDVQAMHQLVAESRDQIDVCDDYGCSGYHYAAKNGHVDVIEGLVQRGSLLIDAPDKNGWTPMHTAAYFQQGAVIELLVRLGSKAIDTPDPIRRTPIHLAVESEGGSSAVDVIEKLIRLGSKTIDTPDKRMLTPLHLAAIRGQAEVIEALGRLGSRAFDVSDDAGATPLHRAAQNGNVKAIEPLVRLGSRSLDTLDKDGKSPLFAAAQQNESEVIEVLVRLGSRALDTPDNKGLTPMHASARCHWAEGKTPATVETLVRLGSKSIDAVDRNGKTPLHHTIGYYHSNIGAMEALVRWGSRAIDWPDNSGSTAMKMAIQCYSPDAVEALIRLGSRVLDRPESFFIDFGRICNRIQVLLAVIGIPQHFYHRTSERDLKWSEEEAATLRTPIHAATSKRHLNAIETLVRLGSRAIDTPDGIGSTPLYAAALKGHVSVIETLLRLGSNAIDTPNNNGWAPKHAAAYMGHGPAARLLLALSTDPAEAFPLQGQIIKLTEDEVVEKRYDVYFGHSLVRRLFFQLD